MATDAVIQFKYSDDVHLAAIYKRYDAFPQDIIQSLKVYLRDTRNLEWDFIVADIIARFVEDSLDRKGIKILPKMPAKRDTSFIYLWQIFPKEDEFIRPDIPFEQSVYVNIWAGNQRQLLYSGYIAECKLKMR